MDTATAGGYWNYSAATTTAATAHIAITTPPATTTTTAPSNSMATGRINDRYDTRDGGSSHGDGRRRATQERVTNRPRRDVDTQIGSRDGSRPRGSNGADGSPRLRGDRRSSREGIGDSGVPQVDRRGGGSPGAPRMEQRESLDAEPGIGG